MMQPETGTALDVSPRNIFTLRCLASVQDNVLLPKIFEWRDEGGPIADNGNTILISHRGTSLPQSVSELTVSALSVGSYTYFCTVSLAILGGNNLVADVSGVVNVRGEMLAI